ncbi:PDZ domain-containing protein [Chlamydiota bacterium]
MQLSVFLMVVLYFTKTGTFHYDLKNEFYSLRNDVLPTHKKVEAVSFPRDKIGNLFLKKTQHKRVITKPYRLDFSLKGVATSFDGVHYAVIEKNTGKQLLIKELDIIDNLIVKNINPVEEEIILLSNTSKQYKIKKENALFYDTHEETAQQEQLTRINDKNWQVGRTVLLAKTKDLNTILNDVRIIPYSKEGKSIGYYLTRIKKGSVIDLAGFKNGDVILEVNSHSIGDFSDIVKIYSELQMSKELKVTLQRKGSLTQNVYKILD